MKLKSFAWMGTLLMSVTFSASSSEVNTIPVSLKQYEFIKQQLSTLEMDVGFPSYLVFRNGLLTNTIQKVNTESGSDLLELIKAESNTSYDYTLDEFSNGISGVESGEQYTVIFISGGNDEQKCGPCDVELDKISAIDQEKEKVKINEVFINISI